MKIRDVEVFFKKQSNKNTHLLQLTLETAAQFEK